MTEASDSGVYTLASQGSITLFGNVLGRGLGFLFVVLATRLVSPEEYGVFTLALSIVMFVQGFASLNIYRAVDFFLPQFLDEGQTGRAKATLRNVFAIGLATSIVGAVVVFLGRQWIGGVFDEPRLLVPLSLFVLLIPLQTVLRTLLTSFNSIKKLQYRVLMRDILNPVGRIVGAVGLVIAGAGVLGLVGGYLLGLSIAILCGFVFLVYEAEWMRRSATKPVSGRSLLTYSMPLVLAGVIYALVGQIDYFAIGYFRGSTEVAYYRVAFLLASNLLIVLTAVTPVFKPMVAESRDETGLLRERYQLAVRWVTMLTIPMAVTLVLAPEVYLSLLFSGKYVVAGSAVVTLTIGYLINASFGPEGMMLEGLGHTRLTLVNTVVMVVVNAVLDIVLVPRFGIVGAAIATGCALALAGLAGVLEIYYLRGIQPLSGSQLKSWVAAIGPIGGGVLFLELASNPYVISFSLPVLVVTLYLLSLNLTGSFTDVDSDLAIRIDEQLGFRALSRIIN